MMREAWNSNIANAKVGNFYLLLVIIFLLKIPKHINIYC